MCVGRREGVEVEYKMVICDSYIFLSFGGSMVKNSSFLRRAFGVLLFGKNTLNPNPEP